MVATDVGWRCRYTSHGVDRCIRPKSITMVACLRAGRVAVERPESLSLVESSLVDYEESAQPKHILMTS